MKNKLIVHPLLFAVYPGLFLFAHNIGQLAAESIVMPILVIASLVLFLWFCLAVAWKDWHRSGLMVSLFVILFFSYAPIRTAVTPTFVLPLTIAWPAFLTLDYQLSTLDTPTSGIPPGLPGR